MNDSPKAFNQVVSTYQEMAAASGSIKAIDHSDAPIEVGYASYTKRSPVVKPSLSDLICDVENNARRCLSPAEFAHWEAGYKSCAVVVNADGRPDKSLERFIRTFPEGKWAVKRIVDSRMREKLSQRFKEVGLSVPSVYMQANDVHGRKWKTKRKDEEQEESNVISIFACADVSPARFLTAEEAAAYLGGLNSRTVVRWAREGYLPAIPIGEGKRRLWRFVRTDLENWMLARRQGGQIAA